MAKKTGRNDPCPCGSGLKYKNCCGRRQAPAPVLYIHPSKQDIDLDPRSKPMGRPYGLIPVGVAALVNALRAQGIAVRGVNHPLEKQIDAAFDLRQWLRKQRGVRAILIDLHWYEHAYGAISVARACKEVWPDAWTILGGMTASGYAREILEHFAEVDLIVRGDAEAPLVDLVPRLLRAGRRDARGLGLADVPNLVYRDGDAIVENKLGYVAATEDLDRLNFVDVDFLEHHERYHTHEYIVTDIERARRALQSDPFRGRWLCTARGCRYNCAYCGGCKSAHRLLAGRRGIVIRSPGRVFEDLYRLREQGVHQASLSYDISELGDTYWRELFGLIGRSGLRIGLYNELFQLPETAFIDAFVQSCDIAHACLALSPLSGSERVRRLNGKYFSNDDLFDRLDVLKRHRVPIFVYFSLNLPGEDDTVIEESVDLARRIYDRYPPSLLKILTSCHTIDPYAPMNVSPERYGIQAEMSSFVDFYTYCRETQWATPDARTELHRGFRLAAADARSLAHMADVWDAARVGREASWWPVPPSW